MVAAAPGAAVAEGTAPAGGASVEVAEAEGLVTVAGLLTGGGAAE